MNLRVKQPLIELEDLDRVIEQPAAHEQSSFDIAALLRMLRARKGIILGTMAGVIALTLIALAFITPTYSATVVMMIDQRKNAVADVNAVLSGLPTDPGSVQNEIQILTSRELALKVVDKLKLDRDAEFNPALAPGLFGGPAKEAPVVAGQLSPGRESAMNGLLKRTRVDQVGLSTTMTISVASVDPQKSAKLTTAVADAYIEGQLDAKFQATQKAVAWLSNRAREMAAQAQADEAAVQKYKADNNIVTMQTGSIVDQQTVSVSVQLVNAKADLAQKSALYNRVLQLQRAGRAVEASQVVASPLIAQLRAQEADLQRQEAQLASRYLPEHPKMVDIQSQKRDTWGKISGEVRRVIDSLANDVAVAQANVGSLQASLDQLQSKFQVQGTASAKLKALESIATSSRTIYEGMLSRLKEVQGQEGIAAADARIISNAMVPTTASPRFTTVIGIAIPASLVLGLLFAFLAEALDPSLRTTEHVDRHLGLPVLATVPETAALQGPAELIVHDPSSSYAESIRGLHFSLSLSDLGKATKVLLITSAVPGEGKTVLAASLARLAARSGRKVIIVDADFRRPAVAHAMGVTTFEGSVVDVLEGKKTLEESVVVDTQSRASILVGADRAMNPSDLITSDALEKLLTTLRSEFDLVIIDSAPLLPVHDTLALAPHSDAALFVTHSGKTSRDAVAMALRSLKSTKVAIAGVALTRTREDPRYDYHDYLYGAYMRSERKAPRSTWQRIIGLPGDLLSRLRAWVFEDVQRTRESGTQ